MENTVLMSMAIDAMENAYAPYSGYFVGAALLAKSGKVYLGCNVENASFGCTNCAERSAFFKAITEGEREFLKIAVAGGKDGKISEIVPCGICLQVMSEFCDGDFGIITSLDNERFKSYTLSQLLPCGFSKENIDKV